MQKVYLTLFFLVPALMMSAQPRRDTLLITGGGEYPLYRYLYVYASQAALTPEYAYDSVASGLFKPIFPHRSYNNTTSLIPYYWLSVTVKNELAYDKELYYWMNSAGLSKVSAYMKTDTGRFIAEGISGFYVWPPDRQLPGRDAQFKFLIPRGATAVILLRVENTLARNAFFAPELADGDLFRQKQQHYAVVMGLILGIMLIAFALNVFFALSLGERIHILYAVYIAALVIEILLLEGIVEDVLNIADRRLVDNITHAFPGVCSLLMVRIMQWFLQQKRSNSWFRVPVDVVVYLLLTISGLFLLNYLIPLPIPFMNVLQACSAVLTGLQLLLVVISAIEKTIQRYYLAWLYLGATVWLLVGLFEYVLGFLGANDIDLIKMRHPNDLQIGLVIEAVVVFIAIIYRYNIYKKEKEGLLKALSDHQQELIHRIVRAEEDERRRIAADLHDDVAATLSTLNLHISNPPDGPEGAKKYQERSLFLSGKAVSDIRSIAHNLLPNDFSANGLFESLRQRVADLGVQRGTRLSLLIEGEEHRLKGVTPIIVYRVINELLANIIRHSLASEAAIQVLVEENSIQIVVEDDGVGFDTRGTAKGIGLRNIRDRVAYLQGSLQIDSGQHGTNIVIHLPLNA